jgi:hypothetical protein
MQATIPKSWFKQFWPWFLIILPLAAVVAGISTLIIASNNQPEMVIDDYYKTGKAVNADLSLITNAKKLGLSAIVIQQDNNLVITIDGLQNNSSIALSLFHATQSKRDRNAMLTADANGQFSYEADETLDGKWTLRLEPFDKAWRLEKQVQFPTGKLAL